MLLCVSFLGFVWNVPLTFQVSHNGQNSFGVSWGVVTFPRFIISFIVVIILQFIELSVFSLRQFINTASFVIRYGVIDAKKEGDGQLLL